MIRPLLLSSSSPSYSFCLIMWARLASNWQSSCLVLGLQEWITPTPGFSVTCGKHIENVSETHPNRTAPQMQLSGAYENPTVPTYLFPLLCLADSQAISWSRIQCPPSFFSKQRSVKARESKPQHFALQKHVCPCCSLGPQVSEDAWVWLSLTL